MAGAFSTGFVNGKTGATTPFVTTSGTVDTNNNRILLGFVGFDSTAASAVGLTWNSTGASPQAMTQIISQASTGTPGIAYLFGLQSPTTGALSLQSSWTGSVNAVAVGAVSLFNVDSTGTGWNNTKSTTGNNASPTITITGGIDGTDICVVGHLDENASALKFTVGSTGWNFTAINYNYGEGYSTSGHTITASMGSAVPWVMVGLNVLATQAGGGGASVVTNRMATLGVR